MISRLSALAATFAVIVTASLAFAANAHQGSFGVAKAVRTVQLEHVVIVAKRSAQAAH